MENAFTGNIRVRDHHELAGIYIFTGLRSSYYFLIYGVHPAKCRRRIRRVVMVIEKTEKTDAIGHSDGRRK